MWMRSSAAAHAVGPHDWREFISLDEDDLRELIDGHLVQIEVPTYDHERIVIELGAILVLWARKHGGRAVASGYKVRISNKRGVMPDLQFFRADNAAPEDQNQGLERGRPDLVVEIVSPSSRRYDRIVKLNWYAQREIPEYWIVDPEGKTFERFVLVKGTYALAQNASNDDIVRPKSFRGLAVNLSDLWPPVRKRRRK
jgi:Uma2 family endonuclease